MFRFARKWIHRQVQGKCNERHCLEQLATPDQLRSYKITSHSKQRKVLKSRGILSRYSFENVYFSLHLLHLSWSPSAGFVRPQIPQYLIRPCSTSCLEHSNICFGLWPFFDLPHTGQISSPEVDSGGSVIMSFSSEYRFLGLL